MPYEVNWLSFAGVVGTGMIGFFSGWRAGKKRGFVEGMEYMMRIRSPTVFSATPNEQQIDDGQQDD